MKHILYLLLLFPSFAMAETKVTANEIIQLSTVTYLISDFSTSGTLDTPTCNIAGSTITLTSSGAPVQITLSGMKVYGPGGSTWVGVVRDGSFWAVEPKSGQHYQWAYFVAGGLGIAQTANFDLFITPTAGTHTYCLHAYSVSAAATLYCGTERVACVLSARETR